MGIPPGGVGHEEAAVRANGLGKALGPFPQEHVTPAGWRCLPQVHVGDDRVQPARRCGPHPRHRCAVHGHVGEIQQQALRPPSLKLIYLVCAPVSKLPVRAAMHMHIAFSVWSATHMHSWLVRTDVIQPLARLG